MPKKTLILIAGLLLVTVVLFFVALKSGKDQTMEQKPGLTASPTTVVQVSPAVPVHTVLALSPNPLTVGSGQQGKVDVNIDTQDNEVTAVQLELAYDPTVVSNVKVTPGTLFASPVVLINRNDAQKGTMTYAFGITPNSQPVTGNGPVATITFTARGAAGVASQLTLLPTTLVTARGVASSVLKSATGTTVVIGAAGSAATTTTTSTGTATVQP